MILRTADEILGHLENGNLAKDFALGVHEVLEVLSGLDDGSGSVTMKLTFDAKGDMVTVKAKLDVKPPIKARRSTNMFLTRSGELSLQHPQQIEMFNGRRRESADQD